MIRWIHLKALLMNIICSTDGAVKLSFESSLKLKDVESENKRVSEGKYEPSDCIPRQSVAILIPHRNRERHLLYLLQHLHPFLQRQQLRYAIYVIHQVFPHIRHRFMLQFTYSFTTYHWKALTNKYTDIIAF